MPDVLEYILHCFSLPVTFNPLDFVKPGFLSAGVYCIPSDSNCKHVYSSYYNFLMSSLTGIMDAM